MKLLFIIGNASVGKLSVGQELMEITNLRLLHNYDTIEPVFDVFGMFNSSAINRLRMVMFEEFAKTDLEGIIYTCMWAFNKSFDWDYIESIKNIFKPYNTDFYYVELVANQTHGINGNTAEQLPMTDNPKRKIIYNNTRLIYDKDSNCLKSNDGNIRIDNYLKIDNSNLEPYIVAKIIKNHFNL